MEVANLANIKVGCWAAETVTQHVNSVRVKCLVAQIAKHASQDALRWTTASALAPTDPNLMMAQTVAAPTVTPALHLLLVTNARIASLKLAANVSVLDQLKMECVNLALLMNSGIRLTCNVSNVQI